ncbi:lipopolysaccharide biosynthesis protein [Vibrio cidicii]|uniref:lipopolysaccharide biosynthesis protein n=1 Tax=Vibrio cidicii TaxID=1763883 RepID=UPI0018C20F8C|nr:oligosaccharide flippase family protein [Vibrio cidicii]MBG0757070.1 polysaccharide biosynthesis protein [Vibrio cidicii]
MKSSPSLKVNILANYTSQLYVTGIGIFTLPLYIKYMGAEAYGLVGFFAMLQAWFALLDLGLTPTISRETARFHGGNMSCLSYRQLFRALSLIFYFIALIGGASLWLLSDLVANEWLKTELLSIEDVSISVKVMAISVALRWLCGLYKGVISGSERLVLLSVFNVFIASMRFLGVFITMSIYDYTPQVFFIHQLCIGILELVGLWGIALRLIPSVKNIKSKIGWSFKPIKSVLKFSLTIAFTSSIWVFVTQTDKLILSGILPLNEYGYFTVAVLLASGIMMISSPLSGAIIPRMTKLYSQGRSEELFDVYRRSSRLSVYISGTAALILVIFPEQVLLAWSGDGEFSTSVSPILKLYALGNFFLIFCAFPGYLQNALGNLKYHFRGNIIIAILLLPSIYFLAKRYGATGAGYAWLSVNVIYFFVWVAYSHSKLIPNSHLKWMITVLGSAFFPFLYLLILSYIVDFYDEQFFLIIQLVLIYFSVLCLNYFLYRYGIGVFSGRYK